MRCEMTELREEIKVSMIILEILLSLHMKRASREKNQ